MKILFVCHRLITFILNEVIELQNLKNDLTIYSYRQNKSIYRKIVLPMLRENKLEEKTVIDFSSRRNRIKLFFFTAVILVNDFLRHPVRTWKSFDLLCDIFEQPKDRIKCYIETRILFDKKFDIIHSPFSTPENIKIVYFLSKIQNVPFTLSFRAHDIYDGFKESIKKKEYILSAENIFITSIYYKNLIESQLLFNKKIEIIHGAVDVQFFKPKMIKKRENSIVSICRFDEVKGIIYLLHACRLLQERKFEFCCYLVGEGPREGEYRNFIRDKGITNVFIKNFIDREGVRNELENSEIFVLPCIELENGSGDILPNSLKEAMSMELPVITSDIRGIRELIDNYNSGILVPQKNPKELADAIEILLKDKALMSRMGKNGRKKILNDFNIKKEAVKINQLLETSVASFQNRNRNPYRIVNGKEMKVTQ